MTQARLFVAVDLPEAVRGRVAEILRDLGPRNGLRWVEPATLHLTLVFLGETDRASIPDICAAIDQAVAAVSPFDLRLVGGGQFPPEGRARVIWMGVEAAGLEALATTVQQALVPLGFEPEDRPFRAHLTIGRARKHPVRAPELDFGEVAAWTVDEVVLFESDLRPAGPVYTALHTSRLGGPF